MIGTRLIDQVAELFLKNNLLLFLYAVLLGFPSLLLFH